MRVMNTRSMSRYELETVVNRWEKKLAEKDAEIESWSGLADAYLKTLKEKDERIAKLVESNSKAYKWLKNVVDTYYAVRGQRQSAQDLLDIVNNANKFLERSDQ